MADFDPYHQWLAIPPKDQPPSHYRLLGVELFESNADVIANAADQRMAHIRTFQTGKHSNLSQKLLNEIATAKICLLNPEKKDAYDKKLRQRAAQLRQQSVTPNVPLVAPSPVTAPQTGELDFLETPSITPRITPLVKPKKSDKNQHWIGLGLLGGTAAVLLIIVLAFNSGRNEKEVASSEPKPSPTIVAPIKKKPIVPKLQDRSEESFKSPEERVDPTNDSPKEAEKPRAISPKEPAEPTPPTAGNLRPQPDSDPNSPVNKFKDPPANTFFPGGEKPKQPSTEEKVEANETAVPPKEDSQATDVSVKPKEKPPDAAAQEQALKLVREVFHDKFYSATTTKQRKALAQELLQKAQTTNDDIAAQYVILKEAGRSAIQAKDADLAFQVIEEMGTRFEVDTFDLKVKSLTAMCKSTGPNEQSNAIVSSLLALMEEAVKKEQFDTAKQLGITATDLARKSRNAAFIKETVARKGTILKEMEEIQKAHAEVEEAVDALDKNPTDPAANLTVGKYRCFTKNEWNKGVPMLALGDDPALKELALKELKGIADAAGQAKQGDAWWDLGEKKIGLAKINIQGHAASWYQQALPGLTGLVKDKVEKRLSDTSVSGEEQSKSGARDWVVVFRSSVPSIWNTDTNNPSRGYAISLAKLSENIKYLRLQIDKKRLVIIPITKGKLSLRVLMADMDGKEPIFLIGTEII